MIMPLEIAPPLPDELVYSTLSRAKFRMGWSTTRFSHRLFGGRTIIVRPHLGGQLDFVAHAMETMAAWPFSATHLRQHHTLFPLVSPLIDALQHPKCVAALHGDRVSRHHIGIVRNILGITQFTDLLSCPRCRREDRSDYGEAYLHRIHQTGAKLCAHHGCALQTCGITAEPEFYTALDEVSEFRTLRVPVEERAMHNNVALDLRTLLEAPADASSLAASVPHLLNLAHRLTGVGMSPLLQLAILASSASGPLSVTLVRQAPASEQVNHVAGTDARWLRRIRSFLADRVDELKRTHHRRVAFLTLKREIETHFRARLPARTHIPRTAAFMDTRVESTEAASQRLMAPRPHEEQSAA